MKKMIKIKIFDESKKTIFKEWVNNNELDFDKAFKKIKRKFL